MSNLSTLQFPAQKISSRRKNKDFYKKCLDSVEGAVMYLNDTVRANRRDKIINYELANGVLNMSDVEDYLDPHKFEGSTSPAQMDHHDQITSRLNLLIGEEYNRNFDFHAYLLNPGDINIKKEEAKNQIIQQLIVEVTESDLTEQQIDRVVTDLKNKLSYDYKDLREIVASKRLRKLYTELDLRYLFNKGFEDLLISSEEIYRIEEINGRIKVRRVNPLNIYTIRSGESPVIEDADIIVEDYYQSPGSIIDEYAEDLKSHQIKEIEDGHTQDSSNNSFDIPGREPILPSGIITRNEDNQIEINDEGEAIGGYGSYYDVRGNIRVQKLTFKSWRKVGKLTIPTEDGGEESEYVDENYKPDTNLGEKVKWFYFPEWHEATKIGENIYLRGRVVPLKCFSEDRPFLSICPYVGISHNINASRARSIIDRIKRYQYLYNELMYDLRQVRIKYRNLGSLFEFDVAKMPENWDFTEWMYWAQNTGILLVDSFKEGNKGAATGKLAGTTGNTSGKVYNDSSTAQYIKIILELLMLVRQEIADVSGISDARLAQINTREAVGNVNREIIQSSYITEKLFRDHDLVKQRVLKVLHEVDKYILRGKKSFSEQYIEEDLTTQLYNVEPDQICDTDMGIKIVSSASAKKAEELTEQLVHAGIQNGQLTFSQVLAIYNSPSMMEKRRKIESGEREAIERVERKEQLDREAIEKAEQIKSETARVIEQQRIENREDEQAHEIAKENLITNRQILLKQLEIDAKGLENSLQSEKELVSQSKEHEHKEREGEKERRSKEKIANSKKNVPKAK